MPENNTPTNDDANNSDAPEDSDAADVLDTSRKGGPFIPGRVSPGPIDPPDGTGGPGEPPGHPHPMPAPPPPAKELIIEVELAPGVENIDDILSGIHTLEPISGGGGAEESDFAAVARTHGLVEAQPIFTSEGVEQHRARIANLREGSHESLAPGGSPEELKHMEALPRLTRYISLRFPPGTSAEAVLAQLRALPQVRHAAVMPGVAPPSLPNDPLIGTSHLPVDVADNEYQPQWYLHRTRVPQAWQHGLGEGVVIADVDFGCRVSHREFIDAIKHTFNSYDETDDVSCGDDVGHGTGVLGIAGARADGKRIAGYAPKATLWAIQFNRGFGPQKSNTPWTNGINHAVLTDAGGLRKVILVEIETDDGGNVEQVRSIRDAISVGILQNCVMVVPAGNGGRRANLGDDGLTFAPSGSILVGATLAEGNKNVGAKYSNYGPEVVVSAPGDEDHDVTCSPKTNTAYRNDFGGTSGAAAKVAGTVALMLSVNPHLSHAEVRDILRMTGSPIIPDVDENGNAKQVGVFLNAEAAVLEARNRLNN